MKFIHGTKVNSTSTILLILTITYSQSVHPIPQFLLPTCRIGQQNAHTIHNTILAVLESGSVCN